MIPLILKLKKSSHKEIARTQDLIIEELCNTFDRAVLHGGTSIWRCYDGNRFSDDIDAYLPKQHHKINAFYENLQKKGAVVIKKKIEEKSIYSSLRLGKEIVRFEAVFRKAEGILKEYKTVEGNLISIYTLTPEELIKEKVRAYLNRLKVRDLYDIFFLLRHVQNKELVIKELRLFISDFKNPVDADELKVLIIEGLTPEVGKMLDYIKAYCKYTG